MPPIRAKDPACAAWNRLCMEAFAAKGFYHSIPLKDGGVLEGIQSVEQLEARVREFPLPDSLAGKRVLDIGTWDGYFAFEMEKRGAEVVAIDSTEIENFYIARELLGSKAGYHVMDVYELDPKRIGRFDVVLFLGVLYHLKHPLYALEKVCSVTREMAIVESYVINEAPGPEIPALEFYETDELLGQMDNWCGPNAQCLLAFCRAAGFARVELLNIHRQRALVACYRQWGPEPDAPEAAAPLLNAATHSSDYGLNFQTSKDEYVSAFFKSPEPDLTVDTVFPEVGPYASRPVAVVHHGGDGWQANFKLPPGLEPGWHEVRLRTTRSGYSDAVRIAVDIPARVERLAIRDACDGLSWERGVVRLSEPARLSFWLEGLPENADRANVRVRLGGRRMFVQDVVQDPSKNAWQVNVPLPAGFPAGEHELTVVCGGVAAAPVLIRVEPLPGQP